LQKSQLVTQLSVCDRGCDVLYSFVGVIKLFARYNSCCIKQQYSTESHWWLLCKKLAFRRYCTCIHNAVVCVQFTVYTTRVVCSNSPFHLWI